jgi:hydroxyacylglutathione hydrolase
MESIIDYGHGIVAIDSGFVRPRLAAVHCIVEDGRAALVDTATNSNTTTVLAALAARGIQPEQVDWILLTHIHLDHAGAAGALARLLPNARLSVHPRGARHMTDPSRLVAGTVAVYGAEETREKYGDILPIASDRIVEANEDSVLRLGTRTIRVLDTPGHARHHVCYVDEATGHIFTGDTFGLSYRELDNAGRAFVLPVTTPNQFVPEAMHESVERIAALRPEAVYLTHFGQVRDVSRLAADLHRLIDAFVAAARSASGAGTIRHERLKAALSTLLEDEAQRQNWRLSGDAMRELLAADIELNAQGLADWLDKQNP